MLQKPRSWRWTLNIWTLQCILFYELYSGLFDGLMHHLHMAPSKLGLALITAKKNITVTARNLWLGPNPDTRGKAYMLHLYFNYSYLQGNSQNPRERNLKIFEIITVPCVAKRKYSNLVSRIREWVGRVGKVFWDGSLLLWWHRGLCIKKEGSWEGVYAADLERQINVSGKGELRALLPWEQLSPLQLLPGPHDF